VSAKARLQDVGRFSDHTVSGDPAIWSQIAPALPATLM
jgi:hypothetical protein